MAATGSGSNSQLLHRQAAARTEPVCARPHSGTGSAVPIGPDAFFGLRFGAGDEHEADPAVIHVPLRPLGSESRWEVWAGPAAAERQVIAGVSTFATTDHLVAHTREAITDRADITSVTRSVYRRLLARVHELGYPHLVRVWNFVPDINGGIGDAETYVRFNKGRAAVFDMLGMQPVQYPAATGVGSPAGSPLIVIVLASRLEPLAIENPRQTSSYLYPRQYGPRSPSFARAMLLPDRTGGKLFISGTASIVGHQSRHEGVGPQLAETLANLQQLMETAVGRMPGYGAGPRRSWRVYLRDPADFGRVESEVSHHLGRDAVVFLQADICRRELVVEIEGVCEITAAIRAPQA